MATGPVLIKRRDGVMVTGSYRHQLVCVEGQLRIRLKRVDLLNPGAALPAVQLFP